MKKKKATFQVGLHGEKEKEKTQKKHCFKCRCKSRQPSPCVAVDTNYCTFPLILMI